MCKVWIQRNGRDAPYLEVQVIREVNIDRESPMNSGTAIWRADGRDVEKERRLISAVEVRIGEVGGGSGSGGRRPSPYREEETEEERKRRLWEDDD